jgi:hypothetical protein
MWTEEKTKKSESFSLGVDQERDGLRVLAIDEIARSVRVTEAGSEKLLTFASHGLTNAVAIAAPTVAPGTPGAVPAANRPPGSPPPLPTPTPNVTPGSISPNAPATPGMRTIPSRNLRVQNNDVTQPTIMAGASSPLPTPVYAGGSGIPQPAPQPNHDPVQQVLMHELQRTVRPDIPPLPPIP